MKYWRIADRPDARQIDEIALLLSAGGVVLMPTDTIYGLHAPAINERAVRAITSLKGRDHSKPFVVLGASIEQLEALGVEVPGDLRDRLSEIWPAPLTVILPLALPIAASSGLATVAVRVPALPWLREVLMRTGPLVSTSANESGAPATTSPGALSATVLAGLDGIVDGGVLEAGASVIVDLTADEPRLLRAGEPFFTQEMWKTLRKKL